MAQRVLLAWASTAGATERVEDIIRDTFTARGMVVTAKPAGDADSPDGYDAVIVGTGIRAGRPYKAAVKYVDRHRAALSSIPVFCFVSCLTMKEDTAESRAEIEKAIDPLTSVVTPRDTGLFAGVMDYGRLGFVPRFVVKKMVKVDEGDFIDREKIAAWAERVGGTLGG